MHMLINRDQNFEWPEAVRQMAEQAAGLDPGLFKNQPLLRLTIGCRPLDMLDWLDAQDFGSKIFWADRGGRFRVAGAGEADEIFVPQNEPFSYAILGDITARLSRSYPELRYYGGFSFDTESAAPEWKDFGRARFVLPRFEILEYGGQFTFSVNIRAADAGGIAAAQNDLRRLRTAVPPSVLAKTGSLTRRDNPAEKDWRSLVSGVLDEIANQEYDKVVLARETRYDVSTPLNPVALLKQLMEHTQKCYPFLFQFGDSGTFLGVSPERLYRRLGSSIETEAIAGTRPCGTTDAEARRLTAELSRSQKDLDEHNFVVDWITRQLKDVTDTFSADPQPSILNLTSGIHLITRFSGKLRDNVPDADLLQKLHPTPAVAGTPADKALTVIREKEPFDRGWYAAPVGFLGHDESEFVVAIRSGLLQDKTLRLFSGAGIVKDSEPQTEWQEVEQKLSAFLSALK